MIDTLFSLAEAHLFMHLVELQDSQPALLPPGKTRPDLYRYTYPFPVLSAFRCCLLLLFLSVAFDPLASLLLLCLSLCLVPVPLKLGSHQR